jgi:hypothetical protein
LVLDGLKWLEKCRKQDRRATLAIVVSEGGPTEDELAATLKKEGYEIASWSVTYLKPEPQCEVHVEMHWRAHPDDTRAPAFLQRFIHHPGVTKVEWHP